MFSLDDVTSEFSELSATIFSLDDVTSEFYFPEFQFKSRAMGQTFFEPDEIFRGIQLSEPALIQRPQEMSSSEYVSYLPKVEGLCLPTEINCDSGAVQQNIPQSPTVLLRNFHVPSSIKHEDCICRIDAYLRSKIPISFHFDAVNCSWKCQHADSAGLCNFDINVYRADNETEGLIVEFQDFDGDRLLVEPIARELKGMLQGQGVPSGVSVPNDPPAKLSVSSSPPSRFPAGSSLKDLSLLPEKVLYEPVQHFSNTQLINAQLKRSVLDEISSPAGHSNLLLAVQSAARIYRCSSAAAEILPIDLEIIYLLLKLLSNYEACDDQICQAVMVALSEMTRFPTFCECVLNFDNANLILQLQQFAVAESCPYNHKSARKYCARILGNMLIFATRNMVDSFGGRQEAEGWVSNEFTRREIGEEAFETVRGALMQLS